MGDFLRCRTSVPRAQRQQVPILLTDVGCWRLKTGLDQVLAIPKIGVKPNLCVARLAWLMKNDHRPVLVDQ